MGQREQVRTSPPARIDAPALAVGLGVPVLAGAAIVLAGTMWADGLGERIAVHWAASGEPTDFGARTTFIAVMTASTVLVAGAMGVVAGLARVWVALRQSMLGLGVGTGVFLGALGVYSLAVQRHGHPGDIAPWVLLVPLLPAVVLGILAARVPRDRRPAVLATTRPDPELPRSSASAVAEHPVGFGGHLRVEGDVVLVRWLGRTPVRLPVAHIEDARPVTVSAMGEFGGWGLRMAPAGRRYGFLGRGTRAVELRKADGERWVVTTPHAEEVAGVVNAAADRTRSP